MVSIKENFDKFIRQENYGHEVLIAHTENKLHCDCWNPTTSEGNPDCPDCFGTGWYYKWFKTTTRRAESGTTLESGKLDFSESIKIHSIGYNFYFKTELPIFANDLIFELNDSSSRLKTTKFLVTNHDVKSDSQDVYQVVSANRISTNNIDLKPKLKQVLSDVEMV
jgi:hypothetical protein